MATPLLGWISPRDRTQRQMDAHERAVSAMPRFALPPPTLAKGQSVRLYEVRNDPLVVADVGFVFSRFRQLTGSCVGVGLGVELFHLGGLQRLFAANPTKAFLPFWGHPYGKSRLLLGDHTPGEGSMGSTAAQACRQYGVLSAEAPGLPSFDTSDGLALTSAQEYAWSDGDSEPGTLYDSVALVHLVGSTAECRDVASIKSAILNGYPCTFACDRYIGSASVQGSGADAAVVGRWDGQGGHQQGVDGYWENATLGPLYHVPNTWAGSTYPTDPAGGPVCSCWVKEADVQRALGYSAEVYAFSHLNWFPAQPKILDWSQIFG